MPVGGGPGKTDRLATWQQRIDNLVSIEWMERDKVEDSQAEIDTGKDGDQLRDADSNGIRVQGNRENTQ